MQSLIILTALGRLASDPMDWEVPFPIRFELPMKVKTIGSTDIEALQQERKICVFEFTGKYQPIVDMKTTKQVAAAIYALVDVITIGGNF